MEKRFWCDELRITGQVDLIVKSNDTLTIVDFKTSYKPSKTWEIQGAAYAYLASHAGYNVKKVMFLHLNKHGKEAKQYEYSTDPTFFLEIYRVYKYFYQEKK